MGTGRLVRVLGPIDVVTSSGPQRIGSAHVRTVLGVLVISAGRAVPASFLHEAVWGSHPPRTADNTMQTYVSQLRRLLGAAAIVNVDHSYVLDIAADQIDASRFERLLAAAESPDVDAEAKRAACRKALALWRGRPFGELADDEAFRLEAIRLDELRVVAIERAIAADLALGRHQLVVGELEAFVEEHPYRESAWYLLIDALTRSGRRLEAARACSRLREQLADARIAPGPQLEALEHTLRDDARVEP